MKTNDLEAIRDFIREHSEVRDALFAEGEKAKELLKINDRRETLINSLVYLVAFEEAGLATCQEKKYLDRVR